MCVCTAVELALALSLSSMVIIVGGVLQCRCFLYEWSKLCSSDWRLTVNGVRPHSCTPTSKLSLGLTGETRVVTLILYVWVVSLCDVYVCIQCSALKGSVVAAVKTQGCMYLQAPPSPTAGSPCDLGFLHPVSYRTEVLREWEMFWVLTQHFSPLHTSEMKFSICKASSF